MEEMGDADKMITLLVKAPDQLINDQIVECQRDWSVGRLKNHLEAVYPTKPKPSDQKIIFGGHILSDIVILGDILQQGFCQNTPNENTYTIHLVCTLKDMANNSSSASPPQELPQATNRLPDIVTPPATVQQYYTQLNSQQMAWMQQAYTHYLTQYMHLMTAQGIQLQSTMPQAPNLPRTETINGPNIQPNNVENEERPAPVPDVVEAGPNPGNNNAGEDAEGGVNRDWLDMFDMMVRVMVLSSIVYFYSSPSRFLVVTFLGFAIYLIQGGFFRGQPMFNENRPENNNPENEPNQEQPQQQQQQQQQQSEANQQRNSSAANSSETNPEVLRATNPNEENERPGAWAFTWTFLTSFFTSLIPEQAPVI